MKSPGAVLMELAAASQVEFVMCAPFAKQRVVDEVLAAVPDGVRILLFTRWRPDEVAAGVSDTGVLPVVRARGGTVHLYDRLHAKYYRNEIGALIGSANLTATALGWSQQPNLELLVSSADADVGYIEQILKANSVVATDRIAREVEELAELLPKMKAPEAETRNTEIEMWIPALRVPSDLYAAYESGGGSLTSRSAVAAAGDLTVLDLPPQLSREQFEKLVGHRLRNQPIFRHIDQFLDKPRRFGEMREMLSRIGGLDRDESEQSWQTVMRWMLEFLPEKYLHNTFRYSEVVALASTDESATR